MTYNKAPIFLLPAETGVLLVLLSEDIQSKNYKGLSREAIAERLQNAEIAEHLVDTFCPSPAAGKELTITASPHVTNKSINTLLKRKLIYRTGDDLHIASDGTDYLLSRKLIISPESFPKYAVTAKKAQLTAEEKPLCYAPLEGDIKLRAQRVERVSVPASKEIRISIPMTKAHAALAPFLKPGQLKLVLEALTKANEGQKRQ